MGLFGKKKDFTRIALEFYFENVSKYKYDNPFDQALWLSCGAGAAKVIEGLKKVGWKAKPDSLDKGKLLLELCMQPMVSLFYHNLQLQEGSSENISLRNKRVTISLQNIQTFLGISSEDSIKLYLGFDIQLEWETNEHRSTFGYMDMFYQRFRECVTGEQIVHWDKVEFPVENHMEFVNACHRGKYQCLVPPAALKPYAAIVSASTFMLEECARLTSGGDTIILE